LDEEMEPTHLKTLAEAPTIFRGATFVALYWVLGQSVILGKILKAFGRFQSVMFKTLGQTVVLGRFFVHPRKQT